MEFAFLLLYVLGALLVIGYLIYWLISHLQMILNLKREKRKAEMLHLKSQVHPHFFFNVLNNLYGLIDQDSSKAKDMVLKLSDLMRYSIYEGEKEYVSIEKEVEFLQTFINLHKMRYHQDINVIFTTAIDNPETKVHPLMFVILVENAFKHGIEPLRDNGFVKIHLDSLEDEVSMLVTNNFDQDIKEKKGIGLKNLKGRLKIIYPKTHTLTTSSEGDIFKAELRILL